MQPGCNPRQTRIHAVLGMVSPRKVRAPRKHLFQTVPAPNATSHIPHVHQRGAQPRSDHDCRASASGQAISGIRGPPRRRSNQPWLHKSRSRPAHADPQPSASAKDKTIHDHPLDDRQLGAHGQPEQVRSKLDEGQATASCKNLTFQSHHLTVQKTAAIATAVRNGCAASSVLTSSFLCNPPA